MSILNSMEINMHRRSNYSANIRARDQSVCTMIKFKLKYIYTYTYYMYTVLVSLNIPK
jgi:hypothetical protein